jgi:SAM-dependent methyltransferase
VIVANSFRYFIDPSEPLKEIRRVLRKDGKLILLDHNRHCPDSLLIRQNVVKYYTIDELTGIISISGFELLKSEYLFIPIYFMPPALLGFVEKIGDLLSSTFVGKIFPEMLIDVKKDGSG